MVVEDLADLGVPLREGCGHAAELEAIEDCQLGTGAMESPEVDDTKAVPVKLPIRDPAPGIGTDIIRQRIRQPQGNLLQLLHLKLEAEAARIEESIRVKN